MFICISGEFPSVAISLITLLPSSLHCVIFNLFLPFLSLFYILHSNEFFIHFFLITLLHSSFCCLWSSSPTLPVQHDTHCRLSLFGYLNHIMTGIDELWIFESYCDWHRWANATGHLSQCQKRRSQQLQRIWTGAERSGAGMSGLWSLHASGRPTNC